MGDNCVYVIGFFVGTEYSDKVWSTDGKDLCRDSPKEKPLIWQLLLWAKFFYHIGKVTECHWFAYEWNA